VIRTTFVPAFAGLLFISILNWNCTKIDTTTLGAGLIPGIDNVNTFDTTFNIIANNIDSVPAGRECAIIYPTDDHALGYIGNDPLFGTTRATIFTELKPGTFPFTFQARPNERTLDSVVLVLSYTRVFGDTNQMQRVSVHELVNTTPFRPDSSTCTTYPFFLNALGATSYIPARLKDTVKAFRDTSINQLRIRLSAAFGQRLLALDTIKTDSAFKAELKGFAIVPDNLGNALTYYSLIDLRTKLAVYYSFKRANLTDSQTVVNFGLYPGDKSANNITRNRTGAEINNFSNNNSNPNGDNFVYIQTSPGSFAQLRIPGLTGLSNRIIHRAELIVEQAPPTGLDNVFAPPSFLYLDVKDTGNFFKPIPCDFTVVQGQPDIGTFGGFRTNVKDPSGINNVARYTFNISRYIQKIITNNRSVTALRLRAPNQIFVPLSYTDECGILVTSFISPVNFVAFGRVKLVGGTGSGTAPNRMRLRVVYTRL